MKKIIIILTILLILPVKTKALEIDKLYMDTEIEVGGALKVKTLIKVKNNNDVLKYKIYFKNNDLKDFTGKEEDFEESKIYNATFVEVLKAGLLKSNDLFNKFYEKEFANENIEYFKEIKSEEIDGYQIVTLESQDKEPIYYLEYIVANVLVEHNDSAELFYKYFDNFGYDINEIKILTRLPYKSKLFKVWAHGSKDWNVTKDIESGFIMLEKNNFIKEDTIDLRILFDKELFAVNINNDKKTNINAVPIIEKIEEEKLNNTNLTILLKHLFIVLSILLISSVISFIIYKLIKRKNK